jgi:hypothetical protein
MRSSLCRLPQRPPAAVPWAVATLSRRQAGPWAAGPASGMPQTQRRAGRPAATPHLLMRPPLRLRRSAPRPSPPLAPNQARRRCGDSSWPAAARPASASRRASGQTCPRASRWGSQSVCVCGGEGAVLASRLGPWAVAARPRGKALPFWATVSRACHAGALANACMGPQPRLESRTRRAAWSKARQPSSPPRRRLLTVACACLPCDARARHRTGWRARWAATSQGSSPAGASRRRAPGRWAGAARGSGAEQRPPAQAAAACVLGRQGCACWGGRAAHAGAV